MNDTAYPYKPLIAKRAYREIREVVDKWEKYELLISISMCWDGCIRVDDELFHEDQLRGYED